MSELNDLYYKVKALEAQAKEHTALIERLAEEVWQHRNDLLYLKARDEKAVQNAERSEAHARRMLDEMMKSGLAR